MADITPTLVFRVQYETTVDGLALTHTINLPCLPPAASPFPDVGDELSTISLETRNTDGSFGTVTADVAISAFVAVFLDKITPVSVISSIVLVYYPNGRDSSGIYIKPVSLSDAVAFPSLQGSRGGSTESAQQETFSFFDSRGKVSKVVVMEAGQDVSSQIGFAALDVPDTAFVTYLIGNGAWVRGAESSNLFELSRANYTRNSKTERQRTR